MLLATHAMGTRFELVLPEGGPGGTANLRAVGEEALREIETWHARLSRFEPGSVVAGINRARAGRLDPETFGLLELCERVRVRSGGAFDITVGRAMERLGFHPSGTPDHSCESKGASGLRLDTSERTVTLDADAALDLGGVAKGFALGRAAAVLLDNGVTDALIHGGTSSVVALGSPDNSSQGWPVAIRSDGEPLTFHLRDRSLGVSAPRGRRAGQHSHILNPATGLPAESAADTAAVVGPLDAAALCDAWSTALVVLGDPPDAWPADLEPHIHTRARGWTGRVACLTELA